MDELSPWVRPPKQRRSRESLERVVDAAMELMARSGRDEFTLAELSRAANVSIGSIYGRLDGKEDLLRLVQARLSSIMCAERDATAAQLAACETLPEAVRVLVRGLAESLRNHRGVLAAIMLRAMQDPEMARHGKAEFADTLEALTMPLRRFARQIPHPDPARALSTSFELMFASLARNLGLGTLQEMDDAGDWDQLLADLAHMMVGYVTLRPTDPN